MERLDGTERDGAQAELLAVWWNGREPPLYLRCQGVPRRHDATPRFSKTLAGASRDARCSSLFEGTPRLARQGRTITLLVMNARHVDL